MPLKAFLCHSSHDSEYVLETAAFLKRQLQVFVYEDHQRADNSFTSIINHEMEAAGVFVIFLGKTYKDSRYLQQEVDAVLAIKPHKENMQIVVVLLPCGPDSAWTSTSIPPLLSAYQQVNACAQSGGTIPPMECARQIVTKLQENGMALTWQAQDDLPYNPHLFSYEKDIIRFFATKMELDDRLYKAGEGKEETLREEIRRKIADGCPTTWPSVVDLRQWPSAPPIIQPRSCESIGAHMGSEFGSFRPDDAMVSATALCGSLTPMSAMTLPEAGPRARLLFPVGNRRTELRVAILVSGGIAPGINAVIDGIVQRHWKYQKCHGYAISVYGYRNGFHGVLDPERCRLFPDEQCRNAANPGQHSIVTAEFANQGGSMLGTYRMDDLISPTIRLQKLTLIAERLDDIDILYMIGGDGTMRAAHALWNVARERIDRGRQFPLSVVAIPKTMDNDILWVWQSFGFMSAVEKARETIQHLHTEVSSNPRLCVLQLFGSDSGFVVSHAVLASATGHCDLALIPEVPFSLHGIAGHLESVINRRGAPLPGGLVVMAETAIPVDAAWYVDQEQHPLPAALTKSDRDREVAVAIRTSIKLKLSQDEQKEILQFDAMRRRGERIQGQTNDMLRRAGLKMVMHGLEAALFRSQPRVLANEPRHLLRAIPPSTSDIIMGQRLGTLAVDNAMAGYTDFMISQWLTEYVLVPLKLVVLGRKRIPESGIFWKSVLAKTMQPADLVSPWPHDWVTDCKARSF